MAARRSKKSWFDVLFDFVAANPRMSAAIAFELGALAAHPRSPAGRRDGRPGREEGGPR